MNKTIHELNSLAQAQADDELIIYDVSEGESKKIQVQALNNPNYSTTEQKTGGTWIDGKPIYRLVYYASSRFSYTDQMRTVCPDTYNVDFMIKCYGIDTQDTNGCLFFRGYSKNGNLQAMAEYHSGACDYVVFEYTKTTDQKFAQKENRVYT